MIITIIRTIHLRNQLKQKGQETNTFDVSRLQFLERYSAESIVEGINGFHGYYAYVFKNYCVLESAIYGNATYIIPKEDWEVLSQKSKQELFDENAVVEKIIHTEMWKRKLNATLKRLDAEIDL